MKGNFPKNKWFIAFVIALVLAVAASATAVVIGVIANRSPEYTEGDEMGVYYYDVEDGEVLLTLSAGNNFTIAGPGMNKTGTYTVEGDTLLLDFFKDDDGTTTATLNGSLLELIYGEAKMNFLKKINYTVSFDVDGGDPVASVKVINGKGVAEPATPTKENNVFLGWYADEALTTPFDFATTTITADTTIYASWAAKTFGVAEYTVDFDLGYDAIAPESITTISGKAYGVKNPVREGYTFGGWWISMYNDAEKLSFVYTDDTVFTADTTLYAVWYDDAATTLKAPAVSVSGNLISWTQVSGADAGYVLTVTAPDGTVLVDNENIAATVKTYDFSALAAGEYVISVTATSSDATKNSAPAVRYYANKTLNRVTNFQVVNGVLVFGAVENAEKYLITIDCGNDDHVHTAFDNGNRTTYNLTNCPMQKGGIKVTVTAMANGFASSTSKTFTYDLTLGAIEKVEYDAAKDLFIWESVAGASEYIVTVTVGDKTYSINNGSFTTFSAAAFTGEISVSVVPATEGYNSPEGTVATCTKTAPAMPTGLTINNMILTWTESAGAVKYEVKIGNELVTVTTNSLDIATAGLVLTQGEFYTAQVRAVSEANEASVYSKALDFGYFAMIKALSYNKNTVSWAPVLGVNTFKVRVNGGAEITVTDATSARVTLTKEGENVIEVKYVAGEDESAWASITVNAIAVEYDTRSTFGSFHTEYLAVGDELLLPGVNYGGGFFKDGYDFVAWATSPMGTASNGAILADGAIFTGNAHTVLYGTWNPKDYELTLKVDGSGYAINNVEDGTIVTVTYTKNFTLPIPEISNTAFKFAGWYTQPHGQGTQLTDATGASITPYPYTYNDSAYPLFSSNALSFTLRPDGKSYSVKAGPGIGEITDVVIPVTYLGKPVTHMEDSSFNSQSNILTMMIPDTIQYIGTKAFRSALNLQKVEIYVAYPEETYEVFYASANGALLHKDMGIWYLECVPKGVAKLSEDGTFVVPKEVPGTNGEIVTAIKVEAFRYTVNLANVIIHGEVTDIPPYAFNSINALRSVTIEEGANPIVFEKDDQGRYPFVSCSGLETLNLPSNFDMDLESFKTFLGGYPKLKAINVSENNPNYRSINGMITNLEGDTIVYCPRGYQGVPNIPRQITKIDELAFAGCNAITDVTIPVWVTSVGKQAFNNSSVTSVTFNGGRSENLSLGDGVFRGCKNMTSITFTGNTLGEIDKGTIAIPSNAFYGGIGFKLETVTIKAGANVTSVGSNAFRQQVGLTTFTVEDGANLGSIGSNAFDGCTALTSFRIPATVTSIASYAFANCYALSDLTFDAATGDDAAISISTYAFTNCVKLRAVVLPDHLSSFNSAAFEGCTALKSITVNDTNPNYKSENGILYKKSTGSDDFAELLFYPTALITENNGIINNLPATLVKIGGSAFSNNSGLISITLPASISSIDAAAFKNCENLVEVILLGTTATENAATSLAISESAFENCSSLATIVLPSYTKSFGKNAFKSSGIVNFVIPENVTTIGSQAFANCTKLETLVFKNTGSVAIPEGGTFKGCTALLTVDLGANVSAIGKNAFENCTALRAVTIATADCKLTRIDNQAFYNCTSLQSITIPTSVKAIGSQAFAATADAPGSLTDVSFELGGTTTLHIYEKAFQYQTALKSITFPARVSLYTGATSTTTDANSNKIAKPVTYTDFNGKTTNNGIADLFLGCSALEALTIAKEEGVEATVYYATVDGVLYTADMTVLIFCPAANAGTYNGETPTYKVTIPNTVKLVMSKAFLDNTKITTIDFAEFDKEDAKYATQILMIGHYGTSATSQNKSYITFGGTSTSITEINLPSHLSTIRGYAFGVTGENVSPMAININPAANKVTLNSGAFRSSAAVTLTLPSLNSINTYAFADTTLLQSVSIASFTGTSLPNYLFQNAVALQSYDIPSTVKTIGQNAFDGCTSLASVTIPSIVTSIGQAAFNNCTALTSVTLPSTLTTLSAQAFMGSGITSITLPANLKTMSNAVFKNCKSLTTVTIKGQITSIAQEMFFGCSNLSSITFTDMSKIASIGAYAFCGAENMTSFPFDRLTSLCKNIQNGAFNHTGITKVDLTKLTALSATMTSAFNNMPKLEELVFAPTWTSLPTSITPSGNYNGYVAYGAPLDNLPALKKVTLNSKFSTSVLVKEGVQGMELPLYIFDYITNNCPGLQIIIPTLSGYVADEFGVYYSTDGKTLLWAPASLTLETYEIPATVKTIGKYAFTASNIGTIIIPRTVEAIENGAFLYANSNIVLNDTLAEPSYLKSIGKYAFAGSKITSFVIPDATTDVDSYAFAFCPELKSLTTGASTVLPYGSYLIRGSFALEELKLQYGVDVLDSLVGDPWIEVLSGYSLKHITIPASVTDMYYSFYGLDSLETITFAEGCAMTYIGSLTFAKCTSLKTIENFPATVSAFDEGIFLDCNSLESLDLSATTIDTFWDYTFANTTALEWIKLPATLTTIGDRAFYNSGIKSIVIPASVTEFGLGVFENATRLETVVFEEGSAITALDGNPDGIWHEYSELDPVMTDAQLFKGTTSLKTVTIPNAVTYIGVSTFENSGIEQLLMSDPTADSALNYIADKAFAGCARLTTFAYVENPDSPEDMVVHNYLARVTEIGEEAFAGCSALTSVEFGADLEYIGDRAFADCTSLERAYIPASVIELGGNPYEGVDVDKIEVDPAHAIYVLETDADGVVYLKDVDSGEILGTWIPEEPTPEEPAEPNPEETV